MIKEDRYTLGAEDVVKNEPAKQILFCSLWPHYEIGPGGHYIFALWLLSFYLSFYLFFLA